MGWIEQTKPNLKFIDWGKLKTGHDKENTLIIKEGENVEGVVTDLRWENDGKKLRSIKLKAKDIEEEIFVWANVSLTRELGYGDDQQVVPVEIGDEIRITFNGMYETASGGKGYDIRVAVNRD